MRSAAVCLAASLAFVCVGLARAQRQDSTPPTIEQPGNVTVASTGPQFSNVTFTVDATDPDYPESQLSIHCDWSTAGKTFPAGTTSETLSVGTWTLNCYAIDPVGNDSAPVSFTITITPFVDTTPPVIQASSQTVPASSSKGTTLFYNVGATDPDDPSSAIVVTCDHNLAGGLFPIGTTTVTCNAHDPAGNNAAPASFTVTVTSPGTPPPTTTTPTSTTTTPTSTTPTAAGGGGAPPAVATAPPSVRDTIAPTINSHPNINADATSHLGAVVTYTVAATDPNTPAAQIVISCSPAAGSFFQLASKATTKTTTVTCNAHDPAGNNATPKSFNVTVLGIHDQIVSLESHVNAAANLSKTRKGSLVAKLVGADRYFAAGAKTMAKSELDSFIKAVVQLPSSVRAATMWIGATTRIIAVSA